MDLFDASVNADNELLNKLPGLGADELETLVRHHNALYWDENRPVLSDVAFDKLVEALRQHRPSSPVLDELGASVDQGLLEDRGFAPMLHDTRMLSLDKCYNDTVLGKWRDKIPGRVTVTPKIDGIACALRYDATGKLTMAGTRGDGKKGDNITSNVREVQAIPRVLNAAHHQQGEIEVRGEVYLPLSRFRKAYASDFANPRNLTAGALKHRDPKQTAGYGLQFFAYDLLGADFATEVEKNAYLSAVGFDTPPFEVFDEGGDLAGAYVAIAEQRDRFDYETDGVVMKADDVALQRKLGATAHHPRYAIAYKFQAQGAQTTLRNVLWSVGRTGVITPVAIVEPVFVSGVTVRRASLHNLGLVKKLGLSEGATIELVRRGDVIPHVERVLAPGGTEIGAPEKCPSCDRPVRIEGDFVYCSDPERCPDVVRGRIKHFVRVIDVNGFGPKHLAQLMERGLVEKPADLFKLTADTLMMLDRMGATIAFKLMRELDRKRTLPLPVFLTALGIDEVGLTVAETLVDRFETLDALYAASDDALSEVHGIGPSIATSVSDALVHRREEIDELAALITLSAPASHGAESDHPLSGKSVVFTGKMATMDRKSAQNAVKALGGKTPSSVSKELDILVVGDDGSPLLGDGKKSTKQKKAEGLIEKGAELALMTERDFITLLGDGAA